MLPLIILKGRSVSPWPRRCGTSQAHPPRNRQPAISAAKATPSQRDILQRDESTSAPGRTALARSAEPYLPPVLGAPL